MSNSYFGCGKDKESSYWKALLRQVLVAGYLRKDIETYGVIKLTPKGKDFIKNPESFMMTEDHAYDESADSVAVASGAKAGGGTDPKLVAMLKDLRKKVGKHLEPALIKAYISVQSVLKISLPAHQPFI